MKMSGQDQDPLAVIAGQAPTMSDQVVRDTLIQRYGLEGTLSSLVSERDQNFHVRTVGGDEFVFKIANAAEASEVTDFQIQALLHISDAIRKQGLPINAPEIVPTLDKSTHIVLNSSGSEHIARVVTYLPGKPVGERSVSAGLAKNLGSYLAYVARALAGFSHSGSEQSLLWDMQQALNLRPLVRFVRDKEIAADVKRALDDFEVFAQPFFSTLRSQVVHSDFNSDNVLVDTGNNEAVAGVIDFGDMLKAPLIVDVAIGASYLRSSADNPLHLIAEFIAGYHNVTPLMNDEIDIVFDLVQARLCASVAILDWRASLRGSDDPYLEKVVEGERSAGHFLHRLRSISRTGAIKFLRRAINLSG